MNRHDFLFFFFQEHILGYEKDLCFREETPLFCYWIKEWWEKFIVSAIFLLPKILNIDIVLKTQ